MSELEPLAVLQDLDTRLDQLAHRRETLPERETIRGLDEEIATIEKQSTRLGTERHSLERDQKRLEDEIAGIEEKKAADNERMYSMTSPKDLSALQEELDSLGRRQDVLEEQVLELMEQIEPLSGEIATAEHRLGQIADEQGRLQAAIAVAEAEIDAEATAVSAEREAHVGTVRDDLLQRYTKLRERSKGSPVVGRVAEGRCSACGLRLSSVFMDELKHSDRDELLQCDECGVLLVP